MNQTLRNLYSIIIFLLCFIVSTALFQKENVQTLVYDRSFSQLLKDEKKISYSIEKVKKTALFREVIFGKIGFPKFVIEGDSPIYLSDTGKILDKVQENLKNDLIKLKCGNNYQLALDSYNICKKWHILSMELVDNRRWRFIIMKNNKKITIDFLSNIPNFKEFEEMDDQYKLTEKYSYIDLRYSSKVGVNKPENSNITP